MAVDLTLKSVAITNREASPKIANNPGAGASGRLRTVKGHLAIVPATLSATSVIRMCEIPSNAVVSGLWFQSAAQTAGKFDIGVYRTNADGGLVAVGSVGSGSDIYFATLVDCASAVVKTDVLNESTSNTIAKQNQPLWQAIGMATDPRTMLDLCLTVRTTDVTTGLGAVSLEAQYTL